MLVVYRQHVAIIFNGKTMVRIRLARSGSKKRPFYYLTVADGRYPRDSRFIERVGFYNPIARGQEEQLRVNLERVDHWLTLGGQATDRVKHLVKQARHSVDTSVDETNTLVKNSDTDSVDKTKEVKTEIKAEEEPKPKTKTEAKKSTT